MKLLPKIALVALIALGNAACSSLMRDRRDAPWDPKPGQSLMDQIPAWDGAANRVCGGHLTEEERQRTGKSPRC
jgi:hypothetical protein